MDENVALLGLACLQSFGQARLRKLLSVFSSPSALWTASARALRERGVDSSWAERFCRERQNVALEKVLNICKRLGASFVGQNQAAFPQLLREIPDAPIGIFVRGSLASLQTHTCAVVGTRKPSSYGRLVTRSLTTALARTEMTIISGLALGVDGIAHDATLLAGGKTVAVLGSGLDDVYPRSHIGLAERIVQHGGALVSEFPPTTPALKHHFPIRNRIIAGLSSGVVVTEAPEKSGALLTAKLALEYNRDVFSVPGPITSPSNVGSNRLCKDGANVVLEEKDILEHYHLTAQRVITNAAPLGADEQRVLACFTGEALTVDQIRQISRLNTSVINAAITLLHVKGWIHPLDALHYVRNR